MILSPKIKAQIKEEALKTPEMEVCGLIVLKENEYLAIPSSGFRKETFKINPSDYLAASQLGKIVGYYHSHVENEDFSVIDKIVADGHKLELVMYCLRTGKFKIYSPSSFWAEYLGIPFVYGKSDCFTLIQNYYSKELNIKINNYYHEEDWSEITPNAYDKNYEKEDFVKILEGPNPGIEDMRTNDCLLFRFLNIPHASHAAVFIKPFHMLHHPRNEASKVEKITKPYLSRACYVLRHKSLC